MRKLHTIIVLVILTMAPIWAIGTTTREPLSGTLVRLTPAQAENLASDLDVEPAPGVPIDTAGRGLYVVRRVAGHSSGRLAVSRTVAGFKSEPVQLASLPEQASGSSASAWTSPGANRDSWSGDVVPFGPDHRLLWQGYVRQPSVTALDLPWLQTAFGSGVTVAMIDGGVDPGHELFSHRLVPGYDFLLEQAGFASEWASLGQSSTPVLPILEESTMTVLEQSSMPVLPGLSQSSVPILGQAQVDELLASGVSLPPAFGHGTMVAGVIHRIAPEASLMPLRAFNGDGFGTTDAIIRAIYFAVDHGADVINMSFTVPEHSPELQAAIDFATAHGVVMVAAVGNDGQAITTYPAAMGAVIGVGSTDPWLRTSSFSNYGNGLVSVAGPGEDVVSSFPGDGWAICAGTSFSAPWVSGLVAVMVETADANLPAALAALSRARPLTGDHSNAFGFGGADARAAWMAVR